MASIIGRFVMGRVGTGVIRIPIQRCAVTWLRNRKRLIEWVGFYDLEDRQNQRISELESVSDLTPSPLAPLPKGEGTCFWTVTQCFENLRHPMFRESASPNISRISVPPGPTVTLILFPSSDADELAGHA